MSLVDIASETPATRKARKRSERAQNIMSGSINKARRILEEHATEGWFSLSEFLSAMESGDRDTSYANSISIAALEALESERIIESDIHLGYKIRASQPE